MSARNTLEAKRARRASRTIRKGRLPEYIDLVTWIKTRSNLTTGECHKIMMSGVLRVDSHRLGYRLDRNGMKHLERYVPAALNDRITIHHPDAP